MASSPIFPANKRYGMHFGHHSPVSNVITARFPDPKTGHLSPSNVSISTYPAFENLGESASFSQTPPPPALFDANDPTPTRRPLPRSQSSSWWMEIRKGPAQGKEPRSRKTAEATITTDATETQPAFESDAFAVHMPTTREPILEPPVFRAKLPSPSRAQVEAYHTYKEKAEQVREKQQQEGVRVPSKIVSYDYACAQAPPPLPSEPESRSGSPTSTAPAGSFPASPPVPQHGWARPAQHIQGPRSMSESLPLRIGRKPVSSTSPRPNDSKVRSFSRADVSAGATRSTPSPSPSKPHTIKLRLKPRSQKVPPLQKEDSWLGFTNRSHQASANNSRSSSPTKNPFVSTTSNVTNTLFGYGTHDISGTTAGASKTPRTPQKPVKAAAKSPSRWAWLRPSGPRVAKPTATFGVPTASTKPTFVKATPYVNPFVLHATPAPTLPTTPTSSRPASPKKLIRQHVQQPASCSDRGKFESGFAQIKSLTLLLLKLCLVVYVLMGLYFLLDAVREVVHVLGAPFRAVRLLIAYIWIGGAFVARYVVVAWEKWRFKVALKGGWKGNGW